MNTDIKNAYVRACSFNPGENMITVGYDNGGNEKKEQYLEVKFRELWFRIYCEENGINGVIDAGELSCEPINESLLLMKSVAKVYMNDTLISQVAAARFVSVGDSDSVQKTVTLAIGRALKEAGFGSLSCLDNEDGGDYPCDSGYTLIRDPNNPEKYVRANNRQNYLLPKKDAESQQRERPARHQQDNVQILQKSKDDTVKLNPTDAKAVPVQKANPQVTQKLTSLKEAYLFKVPFGEYKGKTISEVMAVDSERIRWFSSDAFQANTDQRRLFKEACVMVVKATGNAA